MSAGSNVHWRNNLMLGENSSPAIFSVSTFTSYSSSDYNGFRPNPGAAASFEWSAPPAAVVADFEGPGHKATLEPRSFPTLAEYSRNTGQDRNSVLLDYDVFVNVPRLDAKDTSAVQRLYRADSFDFGLKRGSAAINRGVTLPTVTDGFAGRAPESRRPGTGSTAARVRSTATEVAGDWGPGIGDRGFETRSPKPEARSPKTLVPRCLCASPFDFAQGAPSASRGAVC